MERLIERGCGLDVHRDTVAACVRVPGVKGPREQHVRTFGTTAAHPWRRASGWAIVTVMQLRTVWHGLGSGDAMPEMLESAFGVPTSEIRTSRGRR